MEFLAQELLRHRGPDGTPLPTVRSLALQLDRSPQTVQKALRILKAQGEIHSLPRKGCYWGAAPKIPALPTARPIDPVAKARERLLSDLRCGAYHPHRELPPHQSLAQIYGVSPRRIGQLLEGFVETGILERRGRFHALAQPTSHPSHGTILLVSRCDAHGKLLFDTERETDFMKSVHREGREQNLRIVVAGWHEEAKGGRFLDQQGQELRPEHLPGVLLGTIASTWLVLEPMCLLERLWRLHRPVSVWWEHPKDRFPAPHLHRPSTVGFNLSFGPAPGITVGHHLRALGHRDIAFLSPFHASEWSQMRLTGLLEGLKDGAATVEAFTDARFESAWHYRQAAGDDLAGEAMIRQVLQDMLEKAGVRHIPCWVAVNDHVAAIVLDMLRKRGWSRPHLVSFDNSSLCDAFQIDAFEFHTEGMVRQMIYHILQPGADLFRHGGLHEMVGRLALRS
jgi:DNA-binding transcriptional regulator YhcF (GntR family)